MKLTKENYELIMFDLLEGNLPKEMEDKVLDQIMDDDFYKREWELFRSTVLIPDTELVFARKDDLIKKDTKVIKFPLWISVAVAASLVFAFFLLIPKNDPSNGEITIKEPVINETPTDSQNIPVEEEVLAEQQEEKKPSIQENTPEFVMPVSGDNVIEEEPMEYVVELPEAPKMDSKDGVQFQLTELEDPRISNVSNYLAVESVTSSQLDRITGRTVNTISKLRKPSMSISPNWKERALTVEIETQGYHAMASVAPFKKKQ